MLKYIVRKMYMAKELELTIDMKDKLCETARALSHPIRIEIMDLLNKSILNIKDIASELCIPASTAAMHIKILEEADLINIEVQPGSHGIQKICSRKKDIISINLVAQTTGVSDYAISCEMPIGAFTDAKIVATCGMCTRDRILSCEDKPSEFFSSSREKAELLWSSGGYIEYRYPIREAFKGTKPKQLVFSFEACSEAPNYAEDWPSDITVSLAGIDCCTWRCPGDFGARRGLLSPQWWSNSMATQYGILNRLEINKDGSFLNNKKTSDIKIDDLGIDKLQNIPIRIGNKDDAEYIGGFNLFGKGFGDYPQDLILTIIYPA